MSMYHLKFSRSSNRAWKALDLKQCVFNRHLLNKVRMFEFVWSLLMLVRYHTINKTYFVKQFNRWICIKKIQKFIFQGASRFKFNFVLSAKVIFFCFKIQINY